MSQDPAQSIPPIPEVDQHGGDELPSYEDLAAQNGPNSRHAHMNSVSLSAVITELMLVCGADLAGGKDG